MPYSFVLLHLVSQLFEALEHYILFTYSLETNGDPFRTKFLVCVAGLTQDAIGGNYLVRSSL